jgi:hypothetical protein
MAKTASAREIEVKNFTKPDIVRRFPKGSLEVLHFSDAMVGKAVLEPGWRWSESVQPIARTETCEEPHLQYHLSGTLRIRMTDGTQRDCMPGDVSSVPERHDAWVVGSQPVVVIDFRGMAEYAKPKKPRPQRP